MEPRSGFGIYMSFQFARHLFSQPVICPWCYRRMKAAKTPPLRQNSLTADLAPSVVLWSLVWMLSILQMTDDVRSGDVLSD